MTGDYLAELTMLILGRDAMKDPSLGYARTFVRQAEDCLGLALERGTRIVANAGGLNPAGLADRLREVARGLGLDPVVAHVEGDDLRALSFEGALTANAYLGGFGIAAALSAGADVVVTGRVTDASLVVGPAVAHHGWAADDHDAVAGAVVAGHVLECGTQATGGNFSGFATLPADARSRPLGFPLAEVAADGSCVVTKHDGTGGAVTVDTVTAQLLYEIQSTRYLGPDVTVDLATIELAEAGPDRVAIRGVRGSAPPEQLKVCVNELGGFRNSVELVLTGLDVEAKAAWVREQLVLDPAPQTLVWSPVVAPAPDAATEESASALLRCTVQDPSPEVVGRRFTAAAVELALASYPGFTLTAPPGPATPYGVYRAEYVDRRLGQPHGRPRRRPPRGGRRPADGRPARRGPDRHPALAVPAPHGHADPADAARHVRPRPLRRQGRRRQPRSLGHPRRPGPAPGAGRVALQADHAQEGARAGPRGGRARRRGVPAAATSAASTSSSTACSAGASPPPPASTRRPRGSASGSGRGWCRSRRGCCERGAGTC